MIHRTVLVAIFLAGSARADTSLDQAKSHLRTGAERYDAGDYSGALVEFQRAYELVPSYRILFNIAQVDMELQDHAGAFTAYTRYLREGGPDIPPARLAQVNAELERLRARVGFLVVQTAAGAHVFVDDAQVGYAPLPDPVAVAPGPHRVAVDVPGRGRITRAFDVAVGQRVAAALAVDPPRLAAVEPPAPAFVAPPPAGPRSRVPVYIAWSVTGGLAIGAGVFAAIARGDANDLAALRAKYGVTPDQLDAQRARTVRDAALADVFTGAAIASAGVALYVTVTRLRGDQPPPGERAVQLQIAPRGVAIAGRF